MKNVVITTDTRSGNRDPTNEVAQPGEFECHTYPFKGLKIRSHLRPQFAIFRAGEQISSNDRATVRRVYKDFPEIDKIDDIYHAWQQKLPDDYKERKDFNPPIVTANKRRTADDSDSETGSKGTRRQRLDLTAQRK
jgi:hypothetical protein